MADIKPSGLTQKDLVTKLNNLDVLVSVLVSGTLEGAANSGLTSAAKSTLTVQNTSYGSDKSPTIARTDV